MRLQAEGHRLEDPAVLGPQTFWCSSSHNCCIPYSRQIYARPSLQYSVFLPHDMDRQKLLQDLEILESTYNNSGWLQSHDHEPLIGDPDCPALAQEYGISRVSCYSVFLEEINATYLCRFERCRDFARLRTHCGTKDLTILITDPSCVHRSMEDNGKPLSIGTCFPLVLNFYIAIAASMPEAISSTTRKNVLLYYLDFGIYCPLADKCTPATVANHFSL